MDFAAPKLSFGTSRIAFGRHEQTADGPGTLTRKEKVRRVLMFKEARELLAALPGPGESLYAIQSGSVDLCVLLMAIVEKHPARCLTLRIATLAYAKRNCVELLAALEGREDRPAGLPLLTLPRRPFPRAAPVVPRRVGRVPGQPHRRGAVARQAGPL